MILKISLLDQSVLKGLNDTHLRLVRVTVIMSVTLNSHNGNTSHYIRPFFPQGLSSSALSTMYCSASEIIAEIYKAFYSPLRTFMGQGLTPTLFLKTVPI